MEGVLHSYSINYVGGVMATRSSAVRKQNTQAKTIMVFILIMSLSGLADLIAELMPELEIGPLEIGISTFWFVPLSLCLLFNNWWAALAAPIGELIFSDLVLGEFGGLGEFEEVVVVTIALFAASRLIRDVDNRRQVFIIGILSYIFHELPATFIDIFKVWVGVEELEAVAGLPESIVIIEFVDFFIEVIVTGILFGALPAMWLTPRLHGKIEPLMGLKPRSPGDPAPKETRTQLWIYGGVGLEIATILAVLSEIGINLVEWEPEFLDVLGDWFIWVAIAISVVVAVAVLVMRSNQSKSETTN